MAHSTHSFTSLHSNSIDRNIASASTQQRRQSLSSLCSDLSETSRNIIINDQWLVLGKIGQGSFGEVFEVRDIHTGKAFALKREPQTMRHPQLEKERKYYAELEGGVGIPNCYWYGQYDGFNCMIMDLLGPSLKELRQSVKDIQLEAIVDFGCQMVDILQHVHDNGLVFRDMKPDNFLFDVSCKLPEVEMVRIDSEMPHYTYNVPTCRNVFQQWGQQHPKLYIVDFGLTTYWRDLETGKPHPEGKRRIKNKIGTARYASLNVHHGRLHTRRDDLEGLAYIILDMVLGSLPWSGISARNSKAGWDKMRTLKRDTFMSDLCAGRPVGLVEFAEYTKSLKFAENPDYDYMKRVLRGTLPGGEFSQPARSPFGGGTTSQDLIGEYVEEKKNKDTSSAKVSAETEPKADSTTPIIDEYQASGSSSTSEKAKWKMMSKEKKVGWNTYKHDLEPWNPEIDWNTGNKNTVTASWGDDQPNMTWGNGDTHQKDTSGWGNNDLSGSIGGGWGTLSQDGWGTLSNTQQQQQHGFEAASAEWQTVCQQNKEGNWRTNRRAESSTRDHRQKNVKPTSRKATTATTTHPPTHEHTGWSTTDYGGGWRTNTSGDGWIVNDNREPRKDQWRTRGRRRP
ncbi:kinase-like protein [Lichtheimia hyalospora FSU 10163]|nr:kinase-like protein [Lichtheimia hyalospora FSU 10163]